MMEKNQIALSSKYQKKVVAYLDGSMLPDEKSEFEAYVRTNPEFEIQIKKKEAELSFLRGLIPAVVIKEETLQSLNSEMKQSIYNLLRQEPENFVDKIKNSWEDWINR